MATSGTGSKPDDKGTSSTATSGTATSSAATSGPAADVDSGPTKQAGNQTGRADLMERVARRAPHVDEEFASTYGMTDEDLEAIATGLEPAPPRIGPIKTVDLHRTPGGWQITPVGVAPEDLPETGRVHADEASPGETRTQGQTQAMGTGLSPDQGK